jgi:hypothetical protein
VSAPCVGRVLHEVDDLDRDDCERLSDDAPNHVGCLSVGRVEVKRDESIHGLWQHAAKGVDGDRHELGLVLGVLREQP